jgi:uncharacterized protein involved in exopolysaccharide biosynthesis
MPEGLVTNRRLESPSPTLREVAAVLFRQKRVVAASFIAIFVAAVLYAVLAPSYEAHMKVLVRRGRFDPMVTPQSNAPLEYSRDDIPEEELNSEVELLRDEELLRKVVEAANLEDHGLFRFLHPGEDDSALLERAARRLAGKLKVEPVTKTSLIAVSYAASDPAKAARVLRALADFYVEKHTAVYRPSGQTTFFEQQRNEYAEKLRLAEAALVDFTQREKVVSAGVERDLALQKLSDAEAAQRQASLAAAEARERVEVLEHLLPALPERMTTQVRTADNPQLQEKLRTRLLELELKRTELLTKFEPTYRLVQEVDQQIAEARSAIAAERLTPIRDETTEPDPQYEWARQELEKTRVELRGLQARTAAGESQIAASRWQARALQGAAIQQEDLLRTMKSAEESYLLYVRKREEARIGDALDERGILTY